MSDTLPANVARVQMFWACGDETWHTPETICAVLDISNNTLVNWRAQGKGPAFFKSGHLIFYRKADVVTWFKEFQPSQFRAA